MGRSLFVSRVPELIRLSVKNGGESCSHVYLIRISFSVTDSNNKYSCGPVERRNVTDRAVRGVLVICLSVPPSALYPNLV